MKYFCLLMVLLALVLIPIGTRSQSNSPQSPVEISGEPRHHPKFENEFVRIWDVTVPAGGATLWHAHRNDNVVVTLSGASLRLETVGAAPAEVEWKFGDVRFGKATYVHRAMNVGDHAISQSHDRTSQVAATLRDSCEHERRNRQAAHPRERTRACLQTLSGARRIDHHAHALSARAWNLDHARHNPSNNQRKRQTRARQGACGRCPLAEWTSHPFDQERRQEAL